MIRKSDWTVLVVDDQINVVTGVFCGMRWEEIGVRTVYQAYSAIEAKSILLQNHIDVLLCDIEMPQENGLQLFKWIRDMGMETECIFLSAHADFLYAKSAMQLGSFDYIIQPARYADIENAILRAERKILDKHEQKKYYAYGKSLFQERNRIMDSLLHDWYQDTKSSQKQEDVWNCLAKMGMDIMKETVIYPVLMEIINWHSGIWDKELFRYSCVNIIEELTGGDSSRGMVMWLEHDLWCIWIWEGKGQIQIQTVEDAIKRFYYTGTKFFACDMAIYTGTKVQFTEMGILLEELRMEKENNVALQAKIFYRTADKIEEDIACLPQPDYRTWEALLIKGYGNIVYEEAVTYLEKLTENDTLDAYTLQRYYNEFVRILVSAEEKTQTAHETIFPTPERMEWYLNAYMNIASMKDFIRIITAYFTQETEDENKAALQIKKIKEYIYHNLDKEIRREDIAMEVFMNPSYVSRLFKKEEGMLLKEFIIMEKMKMAQTLLRNSSLPISIVALKVGYSNFSHFSQVYKKIFGISPTEERK